MFPLPLLIEPRPSSLARVLLLILHLAALAALFLAELPDLAQWAGVVLLGAGLAAGRRPTPQRVLRAHRNGRLEIRRDFTWKPLVLQADSVALPGLILLHWLEGRRHYRLTLPADALPRDEHRRLRVWLRWKAVIGTPDGGSDDRLH